MYAIVDGYATGKNYALKVFEVKDVEQAHFRKDAYVFKIVRPIFGRWWDVREHWAPKELVLENLQDAISKAKTLFIKKVFDGAKIPKLEEVVKEMNSVSKKA
jgi:hypothetical protein